MGKQWKQCQTLFLRLQNHCRWWLQPWNLKTVTPWKESYDQPRQHIKKQRHHLADKDTNRQSFVFSSSHVWMWELDRKEGWALKKWCFWTVVLEKTLENPLDCKEIQPVNPKRHKSWIFREGLMLELKLLYFGHLMWRSDSLEKILMLGKIEVRKRRTEDKMAGWHHWLNGHEFEQLREMVKDRETWRAAEQLNNNKRGLF